MSCPINESDIVLSYARDLCKFALPNYSLHETPQKTLVLEGKSLSLQNITEIAMQALFIDSLRYKANLHQLDNHAVIIEKAFKDINTIDNSTSAKISRLISHVYAFPKQQLSSYLTKSMPEPIDELSFPAYEFFTYNFRETAFPKNFFQHFQETIYSLNGKRFTSPAPLTLSLLKQGLSNRQIDQLLIECFNRLEVQKTPASLDEKPFPYQLNEITIQLKNTNKESVVELITIKTFIQKNNDEFKALAKTGTWNKTTFTHTSSEEEIERLPLTKIIKDFNDYYNLPNSQNQCNRREKYVIDLPSQHLDNNEMKEAKEISIHKNVRNDLLEREATLSINGKTLDITLSSRTNQNSMSPEEKSTLVHQSISKIVLELTNFGLNLNEISTLLDYCNQSSQSDLMQFILGEYIFPNNYAPSFHASPGSQNHYQVLISPNSRAVKINSTYWITQTNGELNSNYGLSSAYELKKVIQTTIHIDLIANSCKFSIIDQ